VLVYLCRHAEAAPGDPDELRPLTPAGVQQAQRLGERLAAQPRPPALVLTSPLLRARQTGEVVARALGTEARTEPRLAPGATASALRAIAADVDGPFATVGHQPDCSEIALALTGSDPGFAPAAAHAFEIDR
jgi:phosphohistidine phosphatase